MHIVRRRTAALVGLLVTGALVATACGSDDKDNASSGSGDAGKKVTLNVQLFGTFGYEEAGLFKEYQTKNPNVTIKYSSIQEEQQYFPKMTQQLNAPTGVGDVYGIEVGRIAEVTQNQEGRWVDLNTLGAGDLEKNYYEWKWKAATTKSGKVLGLGTDVGPIAICYRKDLFQQAGLPTDREALSKAWSSWQAYVDMGKQYKTKAPKNSAFMDSASGLYNAALGGSEKQYYDADGKLIYDTNPAVKDAWNLAAGAVEAGTTARLKQFSEDWNKAFASGGFATIACPSWMIGYIKGQDKGANGRWDIAKGPGVANWGGSYLGVPKNSKNQKEAYELAKWLTEPAQQVKLFTKLGSFPSSPVAAQDPAVSGATDAYFSNAPTGQIFGEVAKELPVATLGLKDAVIKDTISNGLQSMETQGKSSEEAWNATVKNIKNAVGS